MQRSWAVSYSTSCDSDGRRGRRIKVMYMIEKLPEDDESYLVLFKTRNIECVEMKQYSREGVGSFSERNFLLKTSVWIRGS